MNRTRFRLHTSIETEDENGQWVPSGHQTVFTAAPTTWQGSLVQWQDFWIRVVCCQDDGRLTFEDLAQRFQEINEDKRVKPV